MHYTNRRIVYYATWQKTARNQVYEYNRSQLPPTDPHNTLHYAHRVEGKDGCSV